LQRVYVAFERRDDNNNWTKSSRGDDVCVCVCVCVCVYELILA